MMNAPQSQALWANESSEADDPVVLEPSDRAPQFSSPRPPTRRRWRRWAVILATGAALVVGGFAWRHRTAAAEPYVTEPVSRGDIVRETTASGMVNPVETVQIGSYVSGRIQSLSCDYNTAVTKGQRCAKIDPRNYEAAVDQAAAAVGTAKAQLSKDQAQLTYAKLTYDRNLTLLDRHVVSQDATDNALNAYKQTEAQAALDKAAIDQREAELKAAQVNLDYTDIVSPVDGTVVSRSVAVGQTVAANFQTPTLFLIATDLTRMQVDANVSEAEIGAIHDGQDATFTVEAFPNRTFAGKVTQIRLAPVSVQNVISYDVIIEAANSDLALKPGMTATAHIVTAQRRDVLKVPEAALRFAPKGYEVDRARAGERTGGLVWVQRGSGLEAVAVRLGLADEHDVEVTDGAIEPGEEVATGQHRVGEAASAASASGESTVPGPP